MPSEGFFASKAWAIESVVAGRYDVDMVNALKYPIPAKWKFIWYLQPCLEQRKLMVHNKSAHMPIEEVLAR
jgi:hypothetical protein